MDIAVTLDGATTDDLDSLYDWLRADAELGPCVRFSKAPAGAGSMGDVIDAVIVAVGSGGMLTVLASTLKAWVLRPKNKSVKLHLERHPDGRQIVNITADDVDDLFKNLRDLR